MLVDFAIVPGLLLFAAELLVLAGVGYLIARVALRQTDDVLALAQGLVIGLGVWGVIVNFVVYLIPGLAGALVGWVVVLATGAGLVWHAPDRIRLQPRAAAAIAVVALALLLVTLAGRQLEPISHTATQWGLASTMRAGGLHPPQLPWHPGMAAPYHYGFDLLVGFLTPPVGPDPALVTELLSAYVFVSYALIVGTLLLRRGSWLGVAALAPLLLAAGTQTFLGVSPGTLQVPVPAGVPAPGLRASLATVYVDGLGAQITVPPNLTFPYFPLAYALALVVLERAVHGRDWRWARPVALALLVGFLGLVDEAVAPIVLALWGLLEVVALWQTRRERSIRAGVVQAASGPVLATLLLATGGGVVSGVLSGGLGGGLSLSWIDHSVLRPSLASFTALAGGVGLLGLGPVVVAGAALLLTRRDRLCVALAAGSGAFVLAALTLQFEHAQHDVARIDGHARNFGLLALLLALSLRLHDLRPRWRYTAAAVIVALLTWPAIVTPVRTLSTAVGGGVQLANAEPGQPGRRQAFPRLDSARVAAYIRDHTDVDARILSPQEETMSIATGRLNAAGFTQAVHSTASTGPEYMDAIRYLDPAAIQRLDFDYVHATDAWIAGLPERANHWLDDPRLFEVLIRDGSDALYRVRPAFMELEAAPEPASYEALRRAVPPSATVYFAPATEELHALRLASALPHARLVGELYPGHISLRTDFGVEALGVELPSLVIVPLWFTPSMFAPEFRQPVWWNDWVAAYSPDGAVEPVMPFTPPPSPPVSVEVSDGEVMDERVSFTVSLTTRDTDRWNGQDWFVIPMDTRVPAYPKFGGPASVLWMAGDFVSWEGTQRGRYEFDPGSGSLSARSNDGRATVLGESGGRPLGPGRWTLVLRLKRAEDKGSYVAHDEVGFIPVLQVEISATGAVTYQVYEGDLGVRLRP
ncbi:MAG: hypothetical protein OXG79_14985 [Chloroflexi bacterium]|nr:hypothetical protein [Chloroflexota bacterium]